MPRTASRPTFLRGRVARVTRVDACGRFILGEYNQAVTEGVIEVTLTENTTETEAIDQANMAGKRCVYEPAEPSLVGYGVVATFCEVDYEVFEIITKQPLVFDAFGRVVGIEPDTKISLTGEGFGLEVWMGSQGADVCDDPDAEGEFGWLLLPLLKGGILGGFAVNNGAITFTITGASTRDGSGWGRGPYAVEMGLDGPDRLFQPVSKTAPIRLQSVTVAPPLPTDGARPVLDPTLPALTSITATGTGLEVDFVVAPVSTGPVWYDFGDETWDYVAIPGEASHVYAEAGTYTVRATQNNIDWAEEEIEVPFP